MAGQFEGREPKEGMNSRKPRVAAASAHSTLGFQLLEESHDQRRIDLLELQVRRLSFQTQLCEEQELAEGIPIGFDGVRARLALTHQALNEESLQQGRQAGRLGHDWSSQRLSRRRMASRINAGEASRYHCVSATFT